MIRLHHVRCLQAHQTFREASLLSVDPNLVTAEQTERELKGETRGWLERPEGCKDCIGFGHFFNAVFSVLDGELGATGAAFRLYDGTVTPEVAADLIGSRIEDYTSIYGNYVHIWAPMEVAGDLVLVLHARASHLLPSSALVWVFGCRFVWICTPNGFTNIFPTRCFKPEGRK
jgi:hypothetical protein